MWIFLSIKKEWIEYALFSVCKWLNDRVDDIRRKEKSTTNVETSMQAKRQQKIREKNKSLTLCFIDIKWNGWWTENKTVTKRKKISENQVKTRLKIETKLFHCLKRRLRIDSMLKKQKKQPHQPTIRSRMSIKIINISRFSIVGNGIVEMRRWLTCGAGKMTSQANFSIRFFVVVFSSVLVTKWRWVLPMKRMTRFIRQLFSGWCATEAMLHNLRSFLFTAHKKWIHSMMMSCYSCHQSRLTLQQFCGESNESHIFSYFREK